VTEREKSAKLNTSIILCKNRRRTADRRRVRNWQLLLAAFAPMTQGWQVRGGSWGI